MHICYIDDSGDSEWRIFSILAVPVDEWKNVLNLIKQFRRGLKAEHGIFVTVEFHATKFVAGRGRIADKPVFKGKRCQIFKDTLAFVSGLQAQGVKLFNASCPRDDERLVFERTINRINRTMQSWASKAILISDQGKDYTSLVRRMGIYNPIQSRFGAWPDGSPTKNMPLDRIIEDLIFRDSADSYFIQLADFCAYALFRSEKPIESKSKYGLNAAFDLLTDICTPECFGADPRRLGIIRDI